MEGFEGRIAAGPDEVGNDRRIDRIDRGALAQGPAGLVREYRDTDIGADEPSEFRRRLSVPIAH
jgi:hypothetical protein